MSLNQLTNEGDVLMIMTKMCKKKAMTNDSVGAPVKNVAVAGSQIAQRNLITIRNS